MTILEILKRALDWEDAYKDMPDYSAMLDRLGLTADDDPEFIRDAIEQEIEALEAAGEEPEGDMEGGAGDVGL